MAARCEDGSRAAGPGRGRWWSRSGMPRRAARSRFAGRWGSSRRGAVTKIWGASSSGPSGKTTKKFGSSAAAAPRAGSRRARRPGRPARPRRSRRRALRPSAWARLESTRDRGGARRPSTSAARRKRARPVFLGGGRRVAIGAAVFAPQGPAGRRRPASRPAFGSSSAHRLTLQGRDSHRHDRPVGRGEPACRKLGLAPARWSGWMSKRPGSALAGAAVDAEVAQKVVVDEDQGAQQERAEAEGQDDRHRLVRGRSRSARPSRQRYGRRRGEEPAQARDEEERGASQSAAKAPPSRGRTRGHGEMTASIAARTTRLAARASTRTKRPRSQERGLSPSKRGAGLGVAGRDGPRAGGRARTRVATHSPTPRPPSADGQERRSTRVDRQDGPEDAGEGSARPGRSTAPVRLPARPTAARLHQVYGEDRPPAPAEAAQDRDRLDLSS